MITQHAPGITGRQTLLSVLQCRDVQGTLPVVPVQELASGVMLDGPRHAGCSCARCDQPEFAATSRQQRQRMVPDRQRSMMVSPRGSDLPERCFRSRLGSVAWLEIWRAPPATMQLRCCSAVGCNRPVVRGLAGLPGTTRTAESPGKADGSVTSVPFAFSAVCCVSAFSFSIRHHSALLCSLQRRSGRFVTRSRREILNLFACSPVPMIAPSRSADSGVREHPSWRE